MSSDTATTRALNRNIGKAQDLIEKLTTALYQMSQKWHEDHEHDEETFEECDSETCQRNAELLRTVDEQN